MKILKKNPYVETVLSRSPILDASLRGHISRAYRHMNGGKQLRRLPRAVLAGLVSKIDAERVLRAQPPFKPNPKRIIIDVTHFCNLGCRNCNRSCGDDQANVQDHMSLGQIKRFIRESIAQKRRWSHIWLEGGEPTLNPQILDIVDELVRYKREHSPNTQIALCTNGYAKPTRKTIEQMPPEVEIVDSGKETPEQEQHRDFNVAPIDLRPDDRRLFESGCVLPSIYGIGLNSYGYYPHPICGSIDRVFGLDVGRKSLPDANDTLSDMYRHLCRYCGHFWDCTSLEEPAVAAAEDRADAPPRTASWRRAYSTFNKRPPQLTRY